MIRVVPVKAEKDFKVFVDFPHTLYKQNRYWVPPLKKEVHKLFNPDENPFWRHAEREMFLAYRGRSLAGRICAILDYNYMEFWNEKTGYFGFFECDDDEDAAIALFQQVRDYFQDKNITKFIGPMNPSTNDECGVLIQGFYTPPFIMMLHNYEYYGKLIEKAGLKKAKDLLAYYFDIKDTPWDYLERVSSLVRRRIQDMKIRPINLADFKNEVGKIKIIYNDAWSRNWGFVPLTDEEIDALAKNLKPLVKAELVPIIEIDNEPVAVSLAVPNYNFVLKRLHGRLGLIEMLKFLYYKNKIKEGRVMVMGVRKEYRKMGLESLLFLESLRAAEQLGYTSGELSWILEDNYAMVNTLDKMGGKVYKRYRIFEGAV